MIIENNKQFLSEKVLIQLAHYKNDNNIRFIHSRDNHLIPMINNQAIHSTYFPLKEGDKLTFSADPKTLNIAIGFGAGYHLLSYINQSDNLLIIPLDYNLLYQVLSQIDFSALINNNSFFKLIDISELYETFDFFKYNSYQLIVHPILQKLYNQNLISVLKHFKETLNPLLLDINTQRKFGKLWLINSLKNLKLLNNNFYSLEPITLDKPLIIAGAGPSLESALADIIKHRKYFHIAASDTGFKILFKHNIIPDFIFTFDPQHLSYYHFAGTNQNKVRIFSDLSSSIRLKGRMMTPLFSNYPFHKLLSSAGINLPFLPSDNRNIGGAIIDFFRKYFSECPIITVGIDFGYLNFQAYCKGSMIDETLLNRSSYFKTLPYHYSEFYYRNSFSNTSSSWKQTGILNTYEKTMDFSNIFTLSHSPFVQFKKIDNLDLFTGLKMEKSSLLLKYCNYDKEYLISQIMSSLSRSQAPLLSYFLASQTENSADLDSMFRMLHYYL